MNRSNAGLIVLFAKLGPKLFPILVKMHDALWVAVKSLFGIKGVGLVGSVGLYTYLFTWQMAVALVVFIGIHEYGHLWAMKRCGIKTKGMFFLPGFGAVAVAEGRFGSARNEAYIAIMGPIFGLVFFVLPMMFVYWKTGDAIWAAIGAIMAFINLVNLFPINPLDGGRILKALAYSERQSRSFTIIVTVSIITAILGVWGAGFTLLGYMAIIGLWETAEEFGIMNRVKKFLITLARTMIGCTFVVIAHYFFVKIGQESGVWMTFVGVAIMGLLTLTAFDVKQSTGKEGRSVFAYPLVVLADVWNGLKQILLLRANHIMPITDYDMMRTGGKALYTFSFVVLILIHTAAIFFLGKVPGAELAQELLK